MTKLIRFVGIALVAASLAALATSTQAAQKYPTVTLNAAQQRSLQKINTFLNSFQTLKSNFTQISSKGQMAQGTLLISKPGKLRFEYAAPNPMLIVSDGRWLTIKNRIKEKGDQFPLSATPLRLVVSSQVDLAAETDVIGFETKDGISSISLADRKSAMGGYITLVFDEMRNQLQQWIIVDGKDRRTTVQLANIETGGKFDPKLFIGKIDRPEGK
ncbi:MAG: outer-membrane lipoprotein carrier protein LolA [Alphaproteobacteria bacterium]|nr:outer-membrane lipoprotein carrier protein LolA [Alphaproteobacteria bacterium]